jgi:hypothetical protein
MRGNRFCLASAPIKTQFLVTRPLWRSPSPTEPGHHMKTPTDRKREQARKAWETEVLARLQTAAGARKFRVLAELTECHPETVRRYLRKGKPSAYFVARMCRVLGVSMEWVFWGTGAMTGGGSDRTAIESKPRKKSDESAAGSSRAGSGVFHDPAAA